jgi:hypothetical protein
MDITFTPEEERFRAEARYEIAMCVALVIRQSRREWRRPNARADADRIKAHAAISIHGKLETSLMAADQLGPSCPTGFVPPADEAIAAITAEWLAEFERAQLILRLSPRLRALHGD